MALINFKNVSFLKSAAQIKGYPTIKADSGKALPEVAVMGRSNVGKSSLLNHLFQRKNLVKTSSVPGKTQLLNFFTVDEQLLLVDFPGYGYAKVPQKLRKRWGPMTQEYMEQRKELEVVLFLLDIRRKPSEEDQQLLDWLAHFGKKVLLVLTKADKLSSNQCQSQRAAIARAVGVESKQCLLYSTSKNIGRKELIASILSALNEPETSNEGTDHGPA